MAIGVGITLFISSSTIASVKYNSQSKDIDFILTDTHVNPSSSGSPFFDKESGKIIGVVSGTFQNNFIGHVMAENKIPTGIQVPRNIGLIRPTVYLKNLIKHGLT
jgi:S1-C subfamily serine protease